MPTLPDDLMALWSGAHSMYGAPMSYAAKELRARWQSLEAESAMDRLRAGGAAVRDTEKPFHEKFQLAFAGVQELLGQRAAVMTQMRKALLHHIGTGSLLSFGFEAPRRVRDMPVALSPAHLSGQLLWDKGEIKAQSLHFVEVGILSAAKAEAILRGRLEEIAPPTGQTYGRPSSVKDIQDAIRAVIEAGKLDPKATMRSHYPMIRAWLREYRPTAVAASVGPSDEAIRRVFGPIFKAAVGSGKKL